MKNFDKIESDILSKIKNISDRNSYEIIKTEIFGKKGTITELFKKIGSLDQSQRKEYASKLNSLKTKVTEIFEKKLTDFDQSEINKKLKNEKIDVTLPGRTYLSGKIHPVSQVIDEVTSIFSEIGFSVEEGPDVENEYYNFLHSIHPKVIQQEICTILFILIVLKIYFYEHIHHQFKLEQC